MFFPDDFFQLSSSKLPLDLCIIEAADHNCYNQHQCNTRLQRLEERFSQVKNNVFNVKHKNPLGLNEKERQWEILCPSHRHHFTPSSFTTQPD